MSVLANAYTSLPVVGLILVGGTTPSALSAAANSSFLPRSALSIPDSATALSLASTSRVSSASTRSVSSTSTGSQNILIVIWTSSISSSVMCGYSFQNRSASMSVSAAQYLASFSRISGGMTRRPLVSPSASLFLIPSPCCLASISSECRWCIPCTALAMDSVSM